MNEIDVTISSQTAGQNADSELDSHTLYDPDGERVLTPDTQSIYEPKGE